MSRSSDLILRSLRSKRLEGWTQRMDSGAILRDARKGALLRMRSEIHSQALRIRLVGWVELLRNPSHVAIVTMGFASAFARWASADEVAQPILRGYALPGGQITK